MPITPTLTTFCAEFCVLVATQGDGFAWAAAPLAFGSSQLGPNGGESTTVTTATSTSPPCTNSQVTVTDSGGGAGLGHEDQILLFTNNSSAACTLTGYPGVAGLNASGQQQVQARRTWAGIWAAIARNHNPPAGFSGTRSICVSHRRRHRQPTWPTAMSALPVLACDAAKLDRTGSPRGLRSGYPTIRPTRLYHHPSSSRRAGTTGSPAGKNHRRGGSRLLQAKHDLVIRPVHRRSQDPLFESSIRAQDVQVSTDTIRMLEPQIPQPSSSDGFPKPPGSGSTVMGWRPANVIWATWGVKSGSGH